jgi:rhamnopyranosyl-N-acetylglucosaminyl-diphospho-decaprenol beta-1,3/1,4-galactofuranosyltransferase
MTTLIRPPSSSPIASVTVTHNPGQLIRRHIDALFAQTRPLDELIVVDNASTDGTVELLRSCYPQVHVLALQHNGGIGGGFAAGLKYSVERGHDWTWLFDQDSVPSARALEELLAAYSADDTCHGLVGVLASLPVNPENGLVYFGFAWRDRFVPIPAAQRSTPLCYVDTVISSGSLVRREVVGKVGLPRSDFFMDFVDHEYNLRIRRHGYAIAIATQSIVHHTLGVPRPVRWFWGTRFRATQPTWRHYLLSRNETFTIWHDIRTLRSKVYLLTRFLRRIVGLLLFDPHGVVNSRAVVVGFWHGMQGRLGFTGSAESLVKRKMKE